MELRLKGAVCAVSFAQSEETIYNEFKKSDQWKGDPKPGEAYVFVSLSGNQLLWLVNVGQLSDGTTAIFSHRLRLSHMASWDRLKDYAAQFGYFLSGKYRSIKELVDEHRRSLHG